MRKALVREAEKIWLSSQELAKYLGISMDTIKTLRDTAQVRFYKPFGNKLIFYRKDEIDKLIEKGKVI